MTEVLFIHGILGKPNYFDFLRPCIPTGDFHTENILLEGHCDTPQAFGRSSMSHWRGQVADAVDRIKASGSRLVIVAHSMGTLFAIESAVKGKADALFLLNPPLSLSVSPQVPVTSLKVMVGRINNPQTAAAKAAYSISDDLNPLHYIGWIPRYLELFAEIRRVRPLAWQLSVPTRVYLAKHDELVSPRSARWFPSHSDIAVVTLPESSHYCYQDSDRNRIISDFIRFIARLEA